MVVNNSKVGEYYKQTNNDRFPGVSCFPTSMINACATVGLLNFPKPKCTDQAKYSQPEDQYDWFIHSKEITDWADSQKDIVDLINQDYDYRELYRVEEYAMNQWWGKDVCKFVGKITADGIKDVLSHGGVFVTSGRFCKFAHVVCVVGFITEDKNSKLTHFIVDDSYGNPLKNYKLVGYDGDDVIEPFDYFWKATEKAGGNHFGIVFLPNGKIYNA